MLWQLQKVVFELFEAVQPHKHGKSATAEVFTQDFNGPIVAKLGDLRLLTGAAAVTIPQTFI